MGFLSVTSVLACCLSTGFRYRSSDHFFRDLTSSTSSLVKMKRFDEHRGLSSAFNGKMTKSSSRKTRKSVSPSLGLISAIAGCRRMMSPTSILGKARRDNMYTVLSLFHHIFVARGSTTTNIPCPLPCLPSFGSWGEKHVLLLSWKMK